MLNSPQLSWAWKSFITSGRGCHLSCSSPKHINPWHWTVSISMANCIIGAVFIKWGIKCGSYYMNAQMKFVSEARLSQVFPLVIHRRLAWVSSHVDDFNTRNKILTGKLLRQGYRYHKHRKAFSKFYRRHFDIVSKYNVGLKTLLLQGLSEPEF